VSKSWLTLIIIAAITLLAWTAFQFYLSITGATNQEFAYVVTPIEDKLPEDVLTQVGEDDEKILVKIDEIKTVPSPTQEPPPGTSGTEL
jgi:hypothetical protein